MHRLRVGCVLCVFAAALGAAVRSDQFDRWGVEDGLPVGFVSGINQTPDGYLWLSTLDGLVRFDGIRFTVFNQANTPALPGNRFTTLYLDTDGTLWAGTESSGLVAYRGGKFYTFNRENGLLDDRVRAIARDPEGRLLVAGEFISQWNGRRFEANRSEQYRTPGTRPFLSREGQVWHLDASGLYLVGRAGRSARLMAARPLGNSNLTIVEDGPGSFWLGASAGGLYHLAGGETVSYGARDGLADSHIRDLRVLPSGELWLATDGGVIRRARGRFARMENRQSTDPFGRPFRLFADREGALWVGGTKGLAVLRNRLITAISRAEGLKDGNTYPILEDRTGTMWVGTWPGLNVIRDGAVRVVTAGGGKGIESVAALAEDRSGAIWVGTYGSGVWRVRNGMLSPFLRAEEVHANGVLAILEDGNGTLWFGTTNGVFRYRNGAYETPAEFAETRGQPAAALLQDHTGAIWIGAQELIRFENGHKTVLGKQHGFTGQVRCFHEDGDGVLWIGTYDNGIYRWKDGRLSAAGTRDGLFDPGVFQILEGANGFFWISCNRGIYRVSRRQLNDFADGRAKSIVSVAYGLEDGLRNIECNGGSQPAGWKRENGELWFPTQDGVAVVHPERMVVSSRPPVVRLEGALLDRKPQNMDHALRIPSGQDSLEIAYTGISFLRPDLVRFRYRMKGLDRDWVDAGNRRVAYYSHIPAGAYVFEVTAANRDGVWSTEPARLQVVGIPPYWHTSGFLLLVALNLAAIAALWYYRHSLNLKAKQAALETFSRKLIESQEAERKRIATELHDSLGQDLMVMKNQAVMALRAGPGGAQEHLMEISAAASQAIEEVRAIAYALRPYQLDRLGLTRAVESMVKRVADSSAIAFRSGVDPVDGLFARESEVSLYRIMQEGINNIVRHSAATEAAVEVRRERDWVRITISDNGRGFAFDPGNTGLGLVGITERVRLLGGSSLIISAPGAGTSIKINIHCEEGSHVRRGDGVDRRRSSDLSQRAVADSGG